MKVYFDNRAPFAFTRHQGFDGAEYYVEDSRVLRAAELIREAEANIQELQEQYGHLTGKDFKPYGLRIEQEVTELIRKLRNLRASKIRGNFSGKESND